jgi:hypothetical protein
MRQQLVLQLSVESIEDYDAVVELEDKLIDALDDGSDVDGHDVGGGTMNLFIWTDDANATFTRAQRVLSDHPLTASLKAGYLDEDAEEYTPLWPAGLARFDVL